MFRRRLTVFVAGTVVLGLLGGAAWHIWTSSPCYAQPDDTQWGEEMLGIVREGRFCPVGPEDALVLPVRLTAIRMQEAIAPEAGELDLSRYEGRAIMVQGHDGGGWVYSAQVTDHAGPILTAVVEDVFSDQD